MVIKNLKIVTLNEVIENGYIEFENGIITGIGTNYEGLDAIDGEGKIAMPGFIDIHTHGSCGIDFMDAIEEDYKNIEKAFYKEGTVGSIAEIYDSKVPQLPKGTFAQAWSVAEVFRIIL